MRGGEMSWLEASSIAVGYGNEEVLKGIDLEVGPGEAVAIVGPNGAGKTTLLKVLSGVLEAERGEVRLKGRRMGDWSRREVAQEVAVVPQAAPQSFSFTVLECVLMGLYAGSRRLVPTREDIEEAERALEVLEMGPFKERSIAGLSGGEMQRVLLARAMVGGSDLWLLDEPTASLDMRHQKSTLGAVRAHVEGEKAAVAVLHDLGLVHRYFDRVVALHRGVVLVDGEPDQVLQEEVVSRLYGTEMRRGEVAGQVVWVVD